MPYNMEKKSGNAGSTKSNMWMGDWYEYCVDSMQRGVMFMDILRIKGNNYLDTIRKGEPPVLAFDYEVILSGMAFERPVNYGDLYRNEAIAGNVYFINGGLRLGSKG